MTIKLCAAAGSNVNYIKVKQNRDSIAYENAGARCSLQRLKHSARTLLAWDIKAAMAVTAYIR